MITAKKLTDMADAENAHDLPMCVCVEDYDGSLLGCYPISYCALFSKGKFHNKEFALVVTADNLAIDKELETDSYATLRAAKKERDIKRLKWENSKLNHALILLKTFLTVFILMCGAYVLLRLSFQL